MELTGKETTNAEGASVQGLDTFQQVSSEIFLALTPESLKRNIQAINSGAIEKLDYAANHLRGMDIFSPHLKSLWLALFFWRCAYLHTNR